MAGRERVRQPIDGHHAGSGNADHQHIDLGVDVLIDSFASVTDAPERSLSMVARIPVELSDVYTGNEEAFCETLVRCRDVSLYLLENAPEWLDE